MGLGFRMWGLGFRIWGLGVRAVGPLILGSVDTQYIPSKPLQDRFISGSIVRNRETGDIRNPWLGP